MAPDWPDIEARLQALKACDKTLQAEGAADHAYAFEKPEDVTAWLEQHGEWLDDELHAFKSIETLFGICKDLDEFRTGFIIRNPDMPFAMRLCSFLDLRPPAKYAFEESDPDPMTVRFRWLEEQYRRYRTRNRFHGGMGAFLRMFPRKKLSRHG